jgi:hypothetical protein
MTLDRIGILRDKVSFHGSRIVIRRRIECAEQLRRFLSYEIQIRVKQILERTNREEKETDRLTETKVP